MASGRKVLTVAFSSEGVDGVKKQIEGVGKAGQDAAAKIKAAFAKTTIGQELAARLNALKIRFADTIKAAQRFGTAWKGVGEAVSKFQDSIKNAIARIAKLTGVLTLAAVGVNKLMSSFGANAENITQMAAALGVTTDQYQRLTAAASDVGIEQGKLDTILAKFTIGVEDAGDAAEKASAKNDKLSKSFEQIVVKGQDGKDKIVTIRRGVQDLSKDVDKFAGVTKTGVDGLLQYAASLEAVGGPAEQLQKAAKDFGAKNALAAVTFFKAFAFQMDDSKRAAAGLIKPLSELELVIGNDMDNAFDNLGTNLKIIKDRLSSVFAPAYTEIIRALTFWIQDNEENLKKWARTINEFALQAIRDFIAILEGAPEKVQNKWLLDLYNGAVKFGEGVKYVFTVVLPEAFAKVRQVADEVAKKLNSVFGTNFTGDTLLVVIALGYLSGAFDIVLKGVILFGSAVYATVQTLLLMERAVGLVLTALRPLFFLVGYLGAALAALLGIPAAVGVAIVAALIVAGVLIYAYWDDVKGYVFATWDAIVGIVDSAINAIVALFGKVPAEWSAMWNKLRNADWSGLYKEIETQSADWWTKFIADTKNEVELINSALQAIGIDLPAVWEHVLNGAKGLWDDIVAGATALGTRLAPAWATVKDAASKLWDGISATATKVWDGIASIITKAATGIADAVSAVWSAATTAISGASTDVFATAQGILDSINKAVSSAGDVQGAVDLAAKLVAPFTDAKAKIEEVWTGLSPILEAKGADIAAALKAPLDRVNALPQAIADAIAGLPAKLDDLKLSAVGKVAEIGTAIVAEITSLKQRVESALAGLGGSVSLTGIVQAFANAASAITSVWGAAMDAVRSQTAAMVSAVTALIQRLAAYLQSLRAAIASAQAQARSSSSGGTDTSARGRAVGGMVSGPGTGISDSILSWLSNGEFVIKARAVKHWGLGVLQAINSMRMPRFAAGGLVGEMAASVTPRISFPRPLDGARSGLTPYTLVFEGKEYPGFMGPPVDTLKELGKARVASRISTPNRVPKWKG